MSLVVQKFGGTSVASPERIRLAAERVLRTQKAGHRVIVIVSAMAGETNRLLGLGHEFNASPDGRELDSLASTGEQVSAALMAIAIQHMGGRACSLLGHQVPIRTDDAFTKARIRAVEVKRLLDTVNSGTIAVVAGFQGIDAEGNVTTLGRGGSDTTAVAVAAAIGADTCEIYTDVEGVFTADPNVCPNARRVERISYEEMLELASLGAKVLQIRSVELAMKYAVPLHVRSSFNDRPGTQVVSEQGLEAVVVAGVTCDINEAKVQVIGIADKPGAVASLFGALAERNVPVDMIVQGPSRSGELKTDVAFTMAKTDVARARAVIDEIAHALGARAEYDSEIVKVSIVGLGMRSHAGIAAATFALLAAEGINIQAISTSEIKLSCVIAARYAELAVRTLHDGFRLGNGCQPQSRISEIHAIRLEEAKRPQLEGG